MLHWDFGENLPAQDHRVIHNLFLILTFSSHLRQCQESIKLCHSCSPGTLHRHLSLYEVRGTHEQSAAHPLKSWVLILTTTLLHCTPAEHSAASLRPPSRLLPCPGHIPFAIQWVKAERKVLCAWLWPGLKPQEQEWPVQLRGGEKSRVWYTPLWDYLSRSPKLLSGKINVLHSLYFYSPSQATSHSWKRKRKITFLDIISVL